MAKKSLSIPAEQLSTEVSELIRVLNKETDLNVMLIGGNFLDACAQSVLANSFIEGRTSDRMLSHTGALGTFSARISLCYILGIISKGLFQDLTKLAEIRNVVAHRHRLDLSFDTPEIAALCCEIKVPGFAPRESDRKRFTFCTALSANRLLLNAMFLKRQGRPKSPPDIFKRVVETNPQL